MEQQNRGKVLMIGVLDVEGSTNIPMALSLMKFGFQVIPVNYRTVINKYGYAFFASLVMNLVVSQKPDLVIVCKGNGIHPSLIQEINKFTKTWIFNMDPGPTIDLVPEVRENAKISTYSSCTALDMAEEWNQSGANCLYLVQGLDEQIFRPMPVEEKFKADISLIGTRTSLRDSYKKILEDIGLNVKFYGRGYTDEEVIDDDFSKVCSSSTFMLSVDSIAGLHTQYFSNRLVRYLGCGACTFHYDPTGSLEGNHFNDMEHLIYFKNEKEFIDKLDIVLNDEETTYEIALSGYNKVLKEYTWDNIMMYILNFALPEKLRA